MPRQHPHSRLDQLARQFGLVITEVRETATSRLGFGLRDTEPVVLKVVRASRDEWDAGAVIRAFQGPGMVRVLEDAEGAVLLERLMPGTGLVDLTLAGRDDEATDILADVIERLGAPRAPNSCLTVTDWGQGFARYLASGDRRIPSSLVERGGTWFAALAASQRQVHMLHGDLQHYNIVHDERRGWVAIDPKGVIGEMEYELGACLRNPTERLLDFSDAGAIERRLRRLANRLPVSPDRALAWCFAQAVLSVIWMVEDGVRFESDDPTLRLATTLRSMVPPAP